MFSDLLPQLIGQFAQTIESFLFVFNFFFPGWIAFKLVKMLVQMRACLFQVQMKLHRVNAGFLLMFG